jgi:hypothetical protein
MMGATVWHSVLAQRFVNAQESGMRMIKSDDRDNNYHDDRFWVAEASARNHENSGNVALARRGRIEGNPSQNVRMADDPDAGSRPVNIVLRGNIERCRRAYLRAVNWTISQPAAEGVAMDQWPRGLACCDELGQKRRFRLCCGKSVCFGS